MNFYSIKSHKNIINKNKPIDIPATPILDALLMSILVF